MKKIKKIIKKVKNKIKNKYIYKMKTKKNKHFNLKL